MIRRIEYNSLYTFDSFLYNWDLAFNYLSSLSYNQPDYINSSIFQPYGYIDSATGLKFMDSLAPAFKNKAAVFWIQRLCTIDSIKLFADTAFHPNNKYYFFLFSGFSGVRQKLDNPIKVDSSYVLSYRYKLGNEYNNKKNIYASMVSGISALFSTDNNSDQLFHIYKKKIENVNFQIMN